MEYDVIIIGGGVAGLTAAQELAEKNLKVCVLDAAPFVGGKPISAFTYPLIPPPQTSTKEDLEEYLTSKPEINTNVKRTLPIEHGFRVYPENYNNLLGIMKRIPTEEGKFVNDYLINTVYLADHPQRIPENKNWFAKLLSRIEKYFFGLSLVLPYISCAKRAEKYDEISVAELFDLENRSPELREVIFLLTDSLSSGMVANTSSLAVINILMNFFYAPDRKGFQTFDRPTHKAWLNYWEAYLNKLNVQIYKNTKVTNINLSGVDETNFDNVKVSEVKAIHENKQISFKGKYIICAIPADALKILIKSNYEMLRYDARLLDIYKIVTLPATGVQLYYEKPITGFEKKLFSGSNITHPWGVTIVDQTNYWTQPEKYAGTYGVISIYLSVTNQVGRYIKKTMQKCSLNEIAYEMFTETENALKLRGIGIPKRIGYFAQTYSHRVPEVEDPIVRYHFNGNMQDQLHLCIVGMRKWRPKPETIYLGNLILCGAYTQTNTFHVSTMEGACESGRRGANVILEKFGLTPVKIHQVEPPKHILWLRSFDKFLYTFWLPNPIAILTWLLRILSKNKNNHMDPSIRNYENLHW